MQRVQKIFFRSILIFLALALSLVLLVQLPYIQRLFILKATNHFSQEYGAEVDIESVSLKPLSGKFSFNSIQCSSFLIDASCSSVEINGWDLVRHAGQIQSADFNNLKWEFVNSISGEAESVSLSSICTDGIAHTIKSAQIANLTTTSGGFGPEEINISSLITSVDFKGDITLKIDTLIADSLNARGTFVLDKAFDIEADFLLDAYPDKYLREFGFSEKLGHVIGQIQFKDSIITALNTTSSAGHEIVKGEFNLKTNSWEIEGSTIIEGSEVYLDAEGDLQSAAGSADIEGYGEIYFDALQKDSGYYTLINSERLSIEGIQITSIEASVDVDKTLENCKIHLSSNELSINTEFKISSIRSNRPLISGSALIQDPHFISNATDYQIETGGKTSASWDFNNGKQEVEFRTNHVKYGRFTLTKIDIDGDIINMNGLASCEKVMINHDGRNAIIASLVKTYASNNDELEIQAYWKSSKGVDGAALIEGGIEDEMDLAFSMITKPITEDQTNRWVGIPIETKAIEVQGKIKGTLQNPLVEIRTHSENLSALGQNINDCTLNIIHENGKNRVSGELIGLGKLNSGRVSVIGELDLNKLNLNTSLYEFPLSYINPLLEKSTVSLGGNLNGGFRVSGGFKNPQIKGDGIIDSCTVQVGYMGTKYTVSGGFHVEPDAIELNGLEVDDGNGGNGILVGTALHNSFKDWNLDVALSAENEPIEVMDIPYSPTRYFYGKGSAIGDINVFGYDGNIVIEANITTSKGTEFVLPVDVVESNKWSSFVEIKNEEQVEEVEKRETNLDLDLNIEVNPESNARIVFNSDLGDEIFGRCKGHLHVDLHDLERLEMVGNLEIVEGEYAFNLKNIISKNFTAVPGGTIRWFGDPYNAHIELSTIYETRASLRPVLPEITDGSKYDINLGLNLKGDLMRPDILFDIDVPEATAQHQASLSSVLANEEELNRQAVSLLVINSFLPSTWHATAVGTTGIQESSSELITSQISHWLSGISDDVNVGIDYDSPVNDGDDTAIALALSTQLFNDRLHIEGEVGTQNLYTGTTDDLQIQDLKIKYDIVEDGTLQLTGYTTQRASVPGLEGESVQGVGFLINRDFDSIWDLFKRKQEKE